MAKDSQAVKALEKALQQLKAQASTPAVARGRAKAKPASEGKSAEYLIKESRRFGDGLLAFYEEEKQRVQTFLDTIDAIDSGSYVPKRGGGRQGAGRRKAATHKEAMEAGDINDNK